MALAAYARNLFAHQRLVDVNLITVVFTNPAGRDADRSSPNTTVSGQATTTITITFPSGQFQILSYAGTLKSAKTLVVTGLTVSQGVATATVTASSALAGAEEGHISFWVTNQ